jgi:putative salt-induced outer membrane protein YdiY
MSKRFLTACVTLVFLSVIAYGDEVIFKSGDRLTGTVKSVANGKMVFDSKVAGKITLKTEDIETFSTDAPIEVVKTDGTSQMLKVAASEGGSVSVLADGVAQPQTLAIADMDKVNPEKPRWKGAVVAGMTIARGNTKSTAANIDANAQLRSEKGRISLAAGYYYANQRNNSTRQNNTTLNNWLIKGQYDYFFSEKMYGYGNLKLEKDRISNLDMRLTTGTGLGRQWIEKDDLNFSTEVGLAYLNERYFNPSETRQNMAARLSYHLDKSINDKVKAFHNLEYLPSTERADTFLGNADVGLRAALTSQLAFEAKAQLAYNSHPSEGREKKDTRYILGLGWTF